MQLQDTNFNRQQANNMKQYVYVNDIDTFLASNGEHGIILTGTDSMHGYDGKWFLVGEVDVDLPEIDRDKLTKDALECIDECEKDIRAQLQSELNRLEIRRQNLLAITHQPSPNGGDITVDPAEYRGDDYGAVGRGAVEEFDASN